MEKEIKQFIENGEIIQFASDDDFMNLCRKKTLGGSVEWIIDLNCKITHMSKTFQSFEKKVDALIAERGLIFVNEDESVYAHEVDPEEKYWNDCATYAERHSDYGEDY